MKHPIYSNELYTSLLGMADDSPSQEFYVNALKDIMKVPDHDIDDYIRLTSALQNIRFSGNQLVTLKNNSDWDEILSHKTFESLTINDILLPFNGFALSVNDDFHKFEMLHDEAKSQSISSILIAKHNSKLTLVISGNIITQNNLSGLAWSTLTEEGDALLKDAITDEEDIWTYDLLFKIVSICFYMTTFKNDTERVVPVKKVVNKGSKKRNIPKHVTTVVSLRQPQYKLDGVAGGSRCKSDKMWMVRGHWRNQPFGKRIEGQKQKTKMTFIDPHWRGEGSQFMMRETMV